eukprot:1515775-Prymnesium_polylepis.1
MLTGSGVKKSELWWVLVRASQTGVSGPVRGDLSCGVQQGTAPDCTDPRKSTMEMYIPTSFVRSTASFA